MIQTMTIRHEITICIGGEAGQGLITLGEVLSKSLVRSGLNIVVTQVYMSRVRGGHNTFTIRAGSEHILAPRESIDMLVALNKETVMFHRDQLSPQSLILTDATHDAPAEPASGTVYTPFSFTDTGVSPRRLPGMSEQLVVADSDEHTEDGHITEDLEIRRRMVEKRQNKLRGIVSRVIPPEFEGDDPPDLLLISRGSSKGAVREAARTKRADGLKVGTLHFQQVWPLVPDHFFNYLKSAAKAVCIEGNVVGQFARLI